MTEELWEIVNALVKSRDRELYRYKYFEDFWKELDREPKIVIIKAPLGSGKTECVFTPFIHSIIKNEYKWLSYIHLLPTRSLVIRFYDRYKNYISILEGKGYIPKNTVSVGYEYGYLPESGRFYFSNTINVSTYDSLVYTFYGFRVPKLWRILPVARLSTSLIVFDEVQLLQDTSNYALSMLKYHVVNLALTGATVVLMSATIPSSYIKQIREKAEPRGIKVKVIEAKDKALRGKISKVIIDKLDLNGIISMIESYDKPVLVVVNTVRRAVELFNKYINKYKGSVDKVLLLHSRLRRKTRAEREMALRDLGETIDVVISTQIVEAGFDAENVRTLITDIAPIDSLIQRIGRVSRTPKTEGVVVINVAKEAVKEAEKVYPQDIIRKTINVINDIKDRVNVVDDIVRDVEKTSIYIDKVYNETCQSRISSAYKFVDEYLATVNDEHPLYGLNILLNKNIIKDLDLLRESLEIPVLYIDDVEVYNRILDIVNQHDSYEGDLGFGLSWALNNSIPLPFFNYRNPYSPLVIKVGSREFYVVLQHIDKCTWRINRILVSEHQGIRWKLLGKINNYKCFVLLSRDYYQLLKVNGRDIELGVVRLN